MGWLGKLFGRDGSSKRPSQPIRPARILDVPSGRNIRELGGYPTPVGLTAYRRFLRSGSTEYLTRRDIDALRTYGVTHVLDLRSPMESPERTCCFARERSVSWKNVELYGYDISDPRLMPAEPSDNYLVGSYLTMLANHGAVREIIAFCATVPRDACVLFHCAAGMDRTGVTALLLLAIVGVSREQIVKDYGYSFDKIAVVDRAVETGEHVDSNPWMSLNDRIAAMFTVYDTLMGAYGSVEEYLTDCGATPDELALLRARMLED